MKKPLIKDACRRCSYYTGKGNNHYKCAIPGECPAFPVELEQKDENEVSDIEAAFNAGWCACLESNRKNLKAGVIAWENYKKRAGL